MNSRYDILQKNAMVGCEEMTQMRGGVISSSSSVSVSLSDRSFGGGGGGGGDPVVYPKPRRVVGCLANQSTVSLRWHKRSTQAEVGDSKAGAELLDLILTKENSYGTDQSIEEVASTPPFFCGSPPSRVSNPLVQDTQFTDGKLSPLSTLQTTSSSPSSPSASVSTHKGGCVRMKFGLKPATVRVEGFDCLSRDCQNSSITAVA